MLSGKTIIGCRQGDITTFHGDAIVNAANTTLLGGGGVDGAIHRAGGPQILEECQRIRSRQGGCKTGSAVITSGGRLRAKHVIHTVGPVWQDGEHGERDLLRSAYSTSLQLALENSIRTIAFPSISTGTFRFPIRTAAEIALRATVDFCTGNPGLDEVVFYLFSREDLLVYQRLIEPGSEF